MDDGTLEVTLFFGANGLACIGEYTARRLSLGYHGLFDEDMGKSPIDWLAYAVGYPGIIIGRSLYHIFE